MNINYSQTNLSTSSYSTQRLLQIVTEGNRQNLQKHLNSNSLEDSELNQALFCCINNCSTLSHHEECLLLLLRADPNCMINDKTPLMSACSAGQEIIVRRLLEYGAKVDSKDSQGNHPLFYALNKNTENFDVIELLIDRMSNLNLEIAKKITPIAFAIRKEFDRTVKKLLDRNITPYVNEQTGDTLLHTVCKQPFRSQVKQERIIKLLLAKIGPHIKNKQGKSSIQYLHSQEMKQMIVQSVKPKLKETKIKLLKKAAQQQQIDLSGDELQEQNSPNSKVLSNILEQSDEDKKQQRKQKGAKNKKISTTIISSHVKTKDLLKSITKSSSNQKFKQLKQPKQIKEKTKIQRKKSFKNVIVKPIITTPSKDSIKQSFTKQHKQSKQTSFRNKQTNVKQIPIKQHSKQKNLRQAKEAKEAEQREEAEIKKLNQQIQQLEKSIFDLDNKFYEECQYMFYSAQNVYLKKSEISRILTVEIQQFVKEEDGICEGYYKQNEDIVDIITKLLRKSFEDQQIRVQMYGSQASRLCLRTSDLDLVIISEYEPFPFLQQIKKYKIFENNQLFKQTKFITSTSVPMIKFQMSQSYHSRQVDITFQTYHHNGVKCNALIKQYLSKMNQLRPLVLVIKKILLSNQLHDTYTGGLGSYSLFLLVVAFLQSTSVEKTLPHSLGLLLVQFFNYYGFQMDYIKKSILIYSPQFSQIPYNNNVFELPNSMDYMCKLVIHDPLNPSNNVSRSTYKIKSIKQLFMLSYNKLFYNRRCIFLCQSKKYMTYQQKGQKPCCLLQRLFIPQILIVQ